jgi:hypothetical protein
MRNDKRRRQTGKLAIDADGGWLSRRQLSSVKVTGRRKIKQSMHSRSASSPPPSSHRDHGNEAQRKKCSDAMQCTSLSHLDAARMSKRKKRGS